MNYVLSYGPIIIILAIVLGIAAAVGLFFLFRAITCWYLKINKMLREQQKTNAYLERIAMAIERNTYKPAQAPGMQQTPSQSPAAPVSPVVAPVSPVVAPVPPVVVPVPPVTMPTAAPVIPDAPSFSQPTPSINIEVAIEKKCPNCGSVIANNAAFCTQCGASANN